MSLNLVLFSALLGLVSAYGDHPGVCTVGEWSATKSMPGTTHDIPASTDFTITHPSTTNAGSPVTVVVGGPLQVAGLLLYCDSSPTSGPTSSKQGSWTATGPKFVTDGCPTAVAHSTNGLVSTGDSTRSFTWNPGSFTGICYFRGIVVSPPSGSSRNIYFARGEEYAINVTAAPPPTTAPPSLPSTTSAPLSAPVGSSNPAPAPALPPPGASTPAPTPSSSGTTPPSPNTGPTAGPPASAPPSACNPPAWTGAACPCTPLVEVYQIFQDYSSGGHSEGSTLVLFGVPIIEVYNNLLCGNTSCPGSAPFVVPGDPDGSYLWQKVNPSPLCGSIMPQGSAALPPAALATIENWILTGARTTCPPTCSSTPPPSAGGSNPAPAPQGPPVPGSSGPQLRACDVSKPCPNGARCLANQCEATYVCNPLNAGDCSGSYGYCCPAAYCAPSEAICNFAGVGTVCTSTAECQLFGLSQLTCYQSTCVEKCTGPGTCTGTDVCETDNLVCGPSCSSGRCVSDQFTCTNNVCLPAQLFVEPQPTSASAANKAVRPSF